MMPLDLITKLDKEKNQSIREKTGTQNIIKEIKQYQKIQHVQRMDTNRIPKQALQYRPKGGRNIGRPRKRWRIKELETRLTLHERDDDDEICSQIFELFHAFKGIIISVYILTSSCILVWIYDHVLTFISSCF
jgi:hypothetical protein